MAKPVKKSGGKKVKRNVPNGVAHIQSTFNNTIVSITDTSGAVIAWSSAGASGFKGGPQRHAFRGPDCSRSRCPPRSRSRHAAN